LNDIEQEREYKMAYAESYTPEEGRILDAGREGWENLHRTFKETWMGQIGPALQLGRELCAKEACVDPSHKDLGRDFNKRMSYWLMDQGYCYTSNETGREVGISSPERSALRKCLEHKAAIISWYDEQPKEWRRQHNHPSRVLAAFQAATMTKPAKSKPTKTKPKTKLEELTAENEKLAARVKVLEGDRVMKHEGLAAMAQKLLNYNPGLKTLDRHELTVALGEAMGRLWHGAGVVQDEADPDAVQVTTPQKTFDRPQPKKVKDEPKPKIDKNALQAAASARLTTGKKQSPRSANAMAAESPRQLAERLAKEKAAL
jgi:hypothetical protein